MKTPTKPLSEINSQAIRLLSEKLGVSDTNGTVVILK